MTNVSESVGRAGWRTPTIRSSNGGPPSEAHGTRLALAIALGFVVGAAIARWLDWRTHAHPRH